MTVGERIKQIREEKRISQTELAEAIHTTKQNIYKYENNIISNIPSDKIEAIAKYLSISPAYLMGWENDVAARGDAAKSRQEQGEDVTVSTTLGAVEDQMEETAKTKEEASS